MLQICNMVDFFCYPCGPDLLKSVPKGFFLFGIGL